jgi:hypothetical protein
MSYGGFRKLVTEPLSRELSQYFTIARRSFAPQISVKCLQGNILACLKAIQLYLMNCFVSVVTGTDEDG